MEPIQICTIVNFPIILIIFFFKAVLFFYLNSLDQVGLHVLIQINLIIICAVYRYIYFLLDLMFFLPFLRQS